MTRSCRGGNVVRALQVRLQHVARPDEADGDTGEAVQGRRVGAAALPARLRHRRRAALLRGGSRRKRTRSGLPDSPAFVLLCRKKLKVKDDSGRCSFPNHWPLSLTLSRCIARPTVTFPSKEYCHCPLVSTRFPSR